MKENMKENIIIQLHGFVILVIMVKYKQKTQRHAVSIQWKQAETREIIYESLKGLRRNKKILNRSISIF